MPSGLSWFPESSEGRVVFRMRLAELYEKVVEKLLKEPPKGTLI
jgi:hypothetical protein